MYTNNKPVYDEAGHGPREYCEIVGDVEAKIVIHCGRNLMDEDGFPMGYSDPYVIIKLSNGETVETPETWGPNPEFNFRYVVPFQTDLTVEFVVMDLDPWFNPDDLIGKTEIAHIDTIGNNASMPLFKEDNVTRAGELLVSVLLLKKSIPRLR